MKEWLLSTDSEQLSKNTDTKTDAFVSFDNRSEEIIKATGIGKKRKTPLFGRLGVYTLHGRRRPLYSGGGVHLHYALGEGTFTYLYIRKNGCSAFKKFFKSLITEHDNNERNLYRIQQKFGVWNETQVRSTTENIAVVRDPAERMCSLFRNKFIQYSFADDIHSNVEERCAIRIEDLTFSTFLDLYVANIASWQNQGLKVDPHCFAQIDHFWPIKYSRIFLMDNLYYNMKDILGLRLADCFFRQRVNNSSSRLDDQHAAYTPVRELREMFHRCSALPSDDALLTDRVLTKIRTIFQPDYQFLACLGFQSALRL